MAPDDMVTRVVRHHDKAKAKLPLGFQPRLADIGAVWHLKDNFSESACILLHCETNAQIPMGVLFGDPVHWD
eukprot:8225632-Lingulodinium_polyedra.AAC.1